MFRDPKKIQLALVPLLILKKKDRPAR